MKMVHIIYKFFVKDEVMTDFDDDWELKAKHSKILNDPDLPS